MKTEQSVSKELRRIQAEFIDKLVVWLGLGAIPSYISLAYFDYQMGTEILPLHHISVLAILALTLVRHKISTLCKYNVVTLILVASGLSSMWAYGFTGMVLLAMAVLVQTVLQRCAIQTVGSILLATMVIAYLHVQYGVTKYSLNDLIRSYSFWATILVSFCLIIATISLSIGSLYRSLVALTEQIEEKNDENFILAHTDAMTQLLNPRALEVLIPKFVDNFKLRPGILCAINLDLDGFKPINDTYGHKAGDFVLEVVASRLKNSVKSSDLVGRPGGDEFVILMYTDSKSNAERAARRILESISQPMTYETVPVKVGCSIGVVVCSDHAITINHESLMTQADATMFDVKKTTKNGYKIIEYSTKSHDPGYIDWLV